jgi:hypothetical protein
VAVRVVAGWHEGLQLNASSRSFLFLPAAIHNTAPPITVVTLNQLVVAVSLPAKHLTTYRVSKTSDDLRFLGSQEARESSGTSR